MRRTCASPTRPCASARRPPPRATSTPPASSRAALTTGAQAIHPGYGFLSENAGFAARLPRGGHRLRRPGRSTRSRSWATRSGRSGTSRHPACRSCPASPTRRSTTPSSPPPAESVGFPLLVKPSARRRRQGHAGRPRDAASSPQRSPAARRVASAAFGDDTLLLERLIERPRHIEVQVLADAHGQRHPPRRARVLAAAPPPEGHRGGAVAAARRRRPASASARAACDAARSVGYLGAGTVEFLVSDAAPDEFFFIEMNTRLQVEHPVTELVTGVDLVEQQLRVAAGEPLALAQHDVRLTGHAIEARVYAESPERGFLPVDGDVLAWRARRGRRRARRRRHPRGPADHGLLRPDDREGHRVRCRPRTRRSSGSTRALADTVVLGVDTNIAFLRALLAEPGGAARRPRHRAHRPHARRPRRRPVRPRSSTPRHGGSRTTTRDERLAAQGAGPAAWQSASGLAPVRAHATEVLIARAITARRALRSRSAARRLADARARRRTPAVVRVDDDGTVWVHHDGRTRPRSCASTVAPRCRAAPRRDRTRRTRRRPRAARAHARHRHRGASSPTATPSKRATRSSPSRP